MKVYTKVKFDLDGNVVEEESFEYEGPVALCGGGGGAGAVSYPEYFEFFHSEMLHDRETDTPTSSFVSLLNSALATGSPYSGESAYNPDAAINSAQLRVTEFKTEVDALDPQNEYTIYGDTAQNRADVLFTDDDVDSDVATIVSTAITNAASEINDAHAKGVININAIISAAVTDATSALGSANTAALAAATAALADAGIDDAVDKFERRMSKEHAKAIARHTGYMAEIGAVNSSAFFFGIALLESEYLDRIAEYDASISMNFFVTVFREYLNLHVQVIADQLRTYAAVIPTHIRAFESTFRDRMNTFTSTHLSRSQSRDRFLTVGVSEMTSLLKHKVGGLASLTGMQDSVSKLKIIAKGEQIDRDLEIDSKDALWDFDLFMMGGNLLAAGQGAMVPRQEVSRFQSALSGALGGASIGAGAGGPPGALIGAGVGAALGAFG